MSKQAIILVLLLSAYGVSFAQGTHALKKHAVVKKTPQAAMQNVSKNRIMVSETPSLLPPVEPGPAAPIPVTPVAIDASAETPTMPLTVKELRPQTLVVLPILHPGSHQTTFGDVSRLMANEASERIQSITHAKVISPLEWDAITRVYGLKASSDKILASCQFGGSPDFQELRFLLDKLSYNGVSIDGIVFLQAVIDRQHPLEPRPQERFLWLKQLFQEPRHDAYYRVETTAKLYEPKVSPSPVWQQQLSAALAYRDFTSVSASVYDDPNNTYLFQKQLLPVTQNLLLTFPGQIVPVVPEQKHIQLNVTGGIAADPKLPKSPEP